MSNVPSGNPSGKRHYGAQAGPRHMDSRGPAHVPVQPKPLSTARRLWLRLQGKAL